MNEEVVIIRLLHILPGVVWLGGALFATLIMEPQLRAQEPAVAAPEMAAVGKMMGPVFSILGLITILSGFALITRTPGHGYDQLFSDGWGWMIGIGIISTFIGFALGHGSMFAGIKISKIAAGIQGRPTPEQMAEIGQLSARIRLLSRSATVMAFIAVGVMASARWV